MEDSNSFNKIKKIANPLIPEEYLELIISGQKPCEGINKDIDPIKKELGSRLYIEVLFAITFQEIEDPQRAEQICQSIYNHKGKMEKKLGRPVQLRVAAEDYSSCKGLDNQLKTGAWKDLVTEMANQAGTDNKTEAFNSDQLKYDMNREIDRAYRYGTVFSIIMIDLDDFKKINDEYGHQKGDLALQFFVVLVNKNLRKLDSLYRFGGDEFLVLLPQTNSKGAERFARKLKDLITATPCKEINQVIYASMGLSTFGNSNINTYEKMIERADKALYKAKREGKNLIGVPRGRRNEILNDQKGSSPGRRETGYGKITCRKIVPGLALGNIFIYRDILSSRVQQYEIKQEEVEDELIRIQNAMDLVMHDISNMQKAVEKEINAEHGAIFLTHKLMLKDSSLINEIEDALNDRLLNGEIVVKDVFRTLEKRFMLFDDKMRREKAKDIRDIGGRVIRKLQGKNNNILASLPENTILVSQRLLPSDTIFLDKKNVKAIVTVEGSIGSHSAILAKALNIPYVTIGKISNRISNHTRAIVDSERQTILVNPGEKEIDEYEKKVSEEYGKTPIYTDSDTVPEYGGKKITLLANVSNREEAEKALSAGAEGVGLFRVENIYMSRPKVPDEDSLLSCLREILFPLKGKEMTIRLLDIGSDKMPPYFNLDEEINPALGLRGIRLLFRHRKLLRTQLTALRRLNKEMPIKILIPMVSLASEVRRVRKMLHDMGEHEIKLGAMIETPAAVFNIDNIMNESDFISIGTNDLIQYSMAADRENKDVAAYYSKGYRVLRNELKEIFEKAKDASKECSICGEAAGEKEFLPSLLRSGLTRFSVVPALLPKVRHEMLEICKPKSSGR